ncbi:MAG: hypothetical protein ACE5E2_04425 [Candidatus Binatia bacterium]
MGQKVILRCLLVLLLTFSISVPWASHAGRVFFKSLEAVIHQINVIVVAKVIKTGTPEPRVPHRRQYTVEVSQVLVGEMETGKAEVYSDYSVPSTKMGNLRVSPIAQHPGSGLESSLQPGKSYIFLFGPASRKGGPGVQITRVEPVQHRDHVIKIWNQYRESLN